MKKIFSFSIELENNTFKSPLLNQIYDEWENKFHNRWTSTDTHEDVNQWLSYVHDYGKDNPPVAEYAMRYINEHFSINSRIFLEWNPDCFGKDYYIVETSDEDDHIKLMMLFS